MLAVISWSCLLLPMIFGKAEPVGELRPEQDVLCGNARRVERALDEHQQVLRVKGLGQEVIGPFLHGPDRRLDGPEGGHDDDRQERILLLHGLQHFEAVLFRQLEVGEHKADALVRELLDALCAVMGGNDLIPLTLKGLLQHGEHAVFVFYDEDRVHSSNKFTPSAE